MSVLVRHARYQGPDPAPPSIVFEDDSSARRYQGAENDIVIVSLVRSNKQNKLGFLGTDDGKNRMCVAQSRSRCGLYLIGNEECLRSSPHWRELLDLLQERGCLGTKFPQRCPRHPHVHKDALEAEHVCTTQSAVCGVLCGAQFGCGIATHTCKRPCHPEEDGNSHSASRCDHLSKLVFGCSETPQHEFQMPCFDRNKFILCPYKERLSCRRFASHELWRKCGQARDDVLRSCMRNCEAQLGCGHQCPKKCSEPCIQEAECREKTNFDCPSFPEHRKMRLACNTPAAEIAASCRDRCSRKLPCRHFCPKRCGEECATECQKPCQTKLRCGHLCPKKCFELCIQEAECRETKDFDCPSFPGHRKIRLACNTARAEIAASCKDQCSRQLRCGHFCPRRCGEECATECQEPCQTQLGCGHLCPKKCFEPCIQEAECREKKDFDCPSFPEKHCKMQLPCNFTVEEVAASCRDRCSRKLPCRHFCPKRCGEKCATECQKPCQTKLRCGHLCPKKCFELCIQEAECRETKDFDCPSFPGHRKIRLACNTARAEIAASCKDQCSRQLRCGHFCPRRCGEECATECQEPCQTQLGCGHLCPKKCFEPCIQEAECREKKDFDCPSFPEKHCKMQLPCNSTVEEVAASCRDRCSRKLPCEHSCPNYCGEPCATTCQKRCGAHLLCGHTCSRRCGEDRCEHGG